MGKGSSEESRGAVLIILCKVKFNPIDLIESLGSLAKIERSIRGNGGEDFIMVDGRF